MLVLLLLLLLLHGRRLKSPFSAAHGGTRTTPATLQAMYLRTEEAGATKTLCGKRRGGSEAAKEHSTAPLAHDHQESMQGLSGSPKSAKLSLVRIKTMHASCQMSPLLESACIGEGGTSRGPRSAARLRGHGGREARTDRTAQMAQWEIVEETMRIKDI